MQTIYWITEFIRIVFASLVALLKFATTALTDGHWDTHALKLALQDWKIRFRTCIEIGWSVLNTVHTIRP